MRAISRDMVLPVNVGSFEAARIHKLRWARSISPRPLAFPGIPVLCRMPILAKRPVNSSVLRLAALPAPRSL